MRSEDSSLSDPVSDAKNMDEMDKATNNMSAARNAKFNSELFKQILPFAKKANIILFVVNHITRKVDIGFVKSARDLIGLGENEAISGGRASLYLANNVLRLKNKGMLKPDKDYGINGNIISATFYKSRTNASNVDCELIFEKSKGFSKVLTLLHFAFIHDLIVKKGSKYYIPGAEEYQFSKKSFVDVAGEHPELLVKLYDLCLPVLQEMIGTEEMNQKSDDENIEFINSMFELDD
jgi:hypothetical protein